MKQLSRLQFSSAFLGNVLEHYDTALFGFLSPFIAEQFFPHNDPLTALILTYAIIPIGMLARPLGSFVFGFLGDKHGTRYALNRSLFGMGAVTTAIAFCPSYSSIAYGAPLLLCLGRLLQNFFAAGELIGGAIFVLDRTESNKKDLVSSWFSASTIAGILLASGLVASFGAFGVIETKWRLLYALGALTAFVAWIIRLKLPDEKVKDPQYASKPSIEIKKAWQYRRALTAIILASAFSYASYQLSLVMLNGFVPLISHFSKAEMASMNTGLLIIDFFMLPLCGKLAQLITRRKLMLGTAIISSLCVLPLMQLCENASIITIITIRISLVLMGVAFFAPFHSWSQSILPKESRYLFISMAYAIGTQLFGGVTATISLWLYKKTALTASIGLYYAIIGLLTALSLYRLQEKRTSYEPSYQSTL